MDQAQNYEMFLDDLYTKEDLVKLLDDIKIASELSFKTDSTEGKNLPKEFLAKLLELEKKGLFPSTVSQQARFFQELENFIRKQKTVRIVFAFEPSKSFLKRVRDYLSEGKSERIFLDLTVDPEIMGGFVLDNQGVYHDYSLVGELNKAVEDKNFLKSLMVKVK